MQEVLLLKCGELVLKGLNRSRFEERLMKIVRVRLRPLGEYKVYTAQSTIYVEPQEGAPVDEALEVVKKVFPKVPTTLLATALSIVVTMVAFFAWAAMVELVIAWYYVVAAFVLGLFVAYGAMFGFDKFKSALEKFKTTK